MKTSSVCGDWSCPLKIKYNIYAPAGCTHYNDRRNCERSMKKRAKIAYNCRRQQDALEWGIKC